MGIRVKAMAKEKRVLDLNMLSKSFAQCGNGVLYDVETSLAENCECGETHRCWFVSSASVSGFDINRVIDRVFAGTKENKDIILKYCFHRILTHSDFMIIDNWVISTKDGLYGQAIDTVLLNDGVASEIIKTLNDLVLRTNDLDRLFFVIRREQGNIDLSKIKRSTIETITFDDLIPEINQFNIDKNTLSRYSNYTLPHCICFKSGAKYKVLDGFKRITAAKLNGREDIDAIILE